MVNMRTAVSTTAAAAAAATTVSNMPPPQKQVLTGPWWPVYPPAVSRLHSVRPDGTLGFRV